MAVRDKAGLKSQILARFPDNVIGYVTTARARDMLNDLVDSLIGLLDDIYGIQTVDTTGANINLNLRSTLSQDRFVFKESAMITGNKNIVYQNTTYATEFVFLFSVDDAGYTFTFTGNNTKMIHTSFDKATYVLTIDDAGEYRMTGYFDGTNWRVSIEGPY